MPLNDRLVISIILEEVEAIEERCPEYTEVLREAVIEIVNAEYEHSRQQTRIQQRIDDICDAKGEWLAKQMAD